MSDGPFRALGASAAVERALAAEGITRPFPIQDLVVPEALSGADILARSPTGSGKTLAFAIPLVERIASAPATTAAIVLVPTRELAVQVEAVLVPIARAKGLRTSAAYGGRAIARQANGVRGAHILVATPGRLEDLFQRGLLSPERVAILVLDEADRMLDLGFRPQVEKIVRRLPARRQTLLFSATLDGEVGDLARAFTRDPSLVEARFTTEVGTGDVEHRFVKVTTDGKVGALVEELTGDRGLVLVFVRTRRGADRLARALVVRGVEALALHGDMPQAARERTISRFRAGSVSTLVATDLAARGIDLVEITHVINYDPPGDHTDYVHRVGRTGRAGRGGCGVTFVLPEQEADLSRVAVRLGHREQFERGGLRVAPARRVYSTRRGRRSRWS